MRPGAPPPGQGRPLQVEVVRGDVCVQQVDAVVTAANRRLVGGSGVNGAVHAAAGPELLAALRGFGGCPTGSAVVTPSFRLRPARWVVHAVGPRYRGPHDADLLVSAYRASLACADTVGARSVAFPSISTGVYGYPDEAAAELSVQALRGADTDVERVLLVAWSARTEQLWRAALAR